MITAPSPTINSQDQPPAAHRRGITWLASYPKSGNTWFRIFLRNLLSETDAVDILQGIGFAMASSRALFDDVAGIDSSDMTDRQIELLRPRVYEQIVDEAEDFPIFFKTHDAFTYLPDGEPLLSRRATAGAVYFVRNPLDVAVSYAFHSGHEDFDYMINQLADSHCCNQRRRLYTQVRQLMFGWSGHVRSWLEADVPVHVMRYEDMKTRTLETFTAAVRFLGLDHGEREIQAALDRSRFEHLQQMELEGGFREKVPRCSAFFRKGKVGSWREILSGGQQQRVIADHGDLMRELGYLTSDGQPVF